MTNEERENAIRCLKLWIEREPQIQTYKTCLEALEQQPCELPSAQLEIVRCGQCKYAEVADSEDSQDGYTCQYHRGSIWFSGSFCSWAERRKDG